MATPCLDSDELSAWVAGALPAAARDAAIAHVGACDACRQAASALARLEGSTADDEPASSGGATAGATNGRDGAIALDDAAALAPGAAIGRFVIERVIGRGGMGVVVAARDPELDRSVAIKLLSAGAAAALDARLAREARVLASVRHANLVPVYEVGTDGDRRFVVMELIAGSNLRQWLARDRPAWRAALRACVDAGRGLCALHAAGFVHRDVKPDNVLVGDDGRVLLADLGLARRITPADEAADPAVDDRDRVTATGALVGTPRYLAPELVAGRPAAPRSDQYAWSAMALEAVRVHGLDAAPAPVRAALTRGVDHDPAARFPTMEALLAAVERAATPSGRRLRIGGAAAAAVGLAAAATIAITSSGSPSQPSTAPRAPAPATTTTAVPVAITPVAITPATTPADPPVAAVDDRATDRDHAPPPTAPPPIAPSPKHPAVVAAPPLPAMTAAAGATSAAPASSRLAALRAASTRTVTTANGVAKVFVSCRLPDDDELVPGAKAYGTADWGPVERREDVDVIWLDGRPRTFTLYQVAGHRRRYVFDAGDPMDPSGALDVAVGAQVLVCPQDPLRVELPAGWAGPMMSTNGLAPIAGDPSIVTREPRPHHVRAVNQTPDHGVWPLPVTTPILAHAAVAEVLPDGRLDMGDWILEVPGGTPGAALLEPHRFRWIIARFVALEPVAGSARTQPVLRADEISPALFAPP